MTVENFAETGLGSLHGAALPLLTSNWTRIHKVLSCKKPDGIVCARLKIDGRWMRAERARVRKHCFEYIRANGVELVEANVLYGLATKSGILTGRLTTARVGHQRAIAPSQSVLKSL